MNEMQGDSKMKKVIASLIPLCMVVFAQTPKTAIAELEQEAKKWLLLIEIGGVQTEKADSYKTLESQFFSFKATRKIEEDTINYDDKSEIEVVDDMIIWTATSKVKIADCPAKSVWEMYYHCDFSDCDWGHKVPPKCKSITPKIVTDYYTRPDQMP
jgi:hypothetical protein